MADLGNLQEVGDGIWRVANKLHPSNSYLCALGESGCFLVDPGTDAEAMEAALAELGRTPSQIFCTHGHFDHVAGAAGLQARYGIPCFMHGLDLPVLRSSNFLMMAFKVPLTMRLPEVTEARGYATTLGGQSLELLEAPGHTPGSCLIRYGSTLFTGDTLYASGVGLSRLPSGDSEQLKATILSRWDEIPGGTMIMPGHGECAAFAAIKTGNLPLLRFLGVQ